MPAPIDLRLGPGGVATSVNLAGTGCPGVFLGFPLLVMLQVGVPKCSSSMKKNVAAQHLMAGS